MDSYIKVFECETVLLFSSVAYNLLEIHGSTTGERSQKESVVGQLTLDSSILSGYKTDVTGVVLSEFFTACLLN